MRRLSKLTHFPCHLPPVVCCPAAGRNFMRGALLGLIATFAGMIIFTAPESIMQLCKIPMPELIQSQPGLLVSDIAGTGEQERAPAHMQDTRGKSRGRCWPGTERAMAPLLSHRLLSQAWCNLKRVLHPAPPAPHRSPSRSPVLHSAMPS